MITDYTEGNLTNNYTKNLKLFKEHAPLVHTLLILKKDERYSLEIENNNLNIAKDGDLLFPDKTLQYHKDLLDAYKKRDKLNLIEYDIGMINYDNSIDAVGMKTLSLKLHADITNNYHHVFKQYPDLSQLNPYHKDRYAMVIFGIGLGYHIPDLIAEYNIQQLVLVDVNIEMLRASLYTLDWESIFRYFLEKNKYRSLEFIVSDDPQKIEKTFAQYINRTVPFAYYNLAQFVLYDDDKIRETIKRITKNIKLYTGTKMGYYDDEKWSLQHTIHNLKAGIPLLKRLPKSKSLDIPVFIIANGPSLDNHIEYIKKHRNKVIVVSAGSSLSSLYNNGIKPDIFVEIERTVSTYTVNSAIAPKEWLEDIIFIGMNTIHPRVFTLFKKSYIFSKPMDSGTLLVNDTETYPQLHYSNPTVSNGALRVLLFLGFKNISFFGMDFGYRSLDKHHSKDSFYYNKESKYYKEKYKQELEVEGVDGGVVYTESAYDNSRKNIEALVEGLKENDTFTIYNYSDGAKIEHTIYAKIEDEYEKDYKELSADDYKKVFKEIDEQFVVYDKSLEIDYNDISKRLDWIISNIKLCKLDGIDAFTYLKLSNFIYICMKVGLEKYPYVFNMLKGTSIYYMAKIYVYVAFQEQDKNTAQFIHDSLDTFVEFIENIKKDIYKWDTTIDIPYQRA